MILTDTTTRAHLKNLSAEYERAQAEQDKAFTTGNATAEAIAHGKCQGLALAVRIVAGLNDDAEAVALLDTLDGER